jgi:putative membrane protein
VSPLVRRWLPNAIRGICMGAADVVPGVSGGTIALVLGIYERLVETIHLGASAAGNLLRGDLRAMHARLREIRWGFILPLLAGIATAVLTLAHVIEVLLEDHPVEMGAVFFGLVAASVWVALGYFKRPERRLIPIVVVSAIATFFLLGLRTDEVSDPSLLFVFGSGALAVCAMILPGISGSFILLMIGMYEYMLSALNDRDLAVAGVFILGAIIGLSLFSSLLDWMLHHFHDIVLAALIGLMIGSLRVLWPWPEGTESPALDAPPAGEWVVPLLLAVAAAAVVAGIGLWARRRAAA